MKKDENKKKEADSEKIEKVKKVKVAKKKLKKISQMALHLLMPLLITQ